MPTTPRMPKLPEMPESLRTLWRGASPLKRVLIAGVPAVVIGLGAAGGIYAAFSGGGGSEASTVAPTATHAAATPSAVPTPAPSPQPTETPASAGLQASSAPPPSGGGGGGGGGSSAPVYQAPAGGTGPGPELGSPWSLSIPAIGVSATIYSRTIGTDGQMGNPSGAWDVVWYDFAANGWSGMGGEPGQPGANVVLAGHVDYIHVGPAVFWSIRDLQPGDVVTVNTPSGPINYSVQWSQWAEPNQDFGGFVSQTGQESVTLVTCIGSFSAGHYSNRYVVRAVRV